MTGAKELRSSALLFLTAMIWGLAFVAQRTGMDYVGPFTFNGVRFLLGAVSLAPVIFVLGRKKAARGKTGHGWRITLAAGLAVGAVLFTAASLQQIGVQLTMSAGKSGFITGLYIVITPLLGMGMGRKAGLPTLLGAALACAGMYLLSVPDGFASVGLGDLALLAGAFFWAGHILIIDHFNGRVHPLWLSLIQFLVCAVLSLAAALWREPIRFSALLDGRAPILYSGLLSVGVAYTLQIVGQRHVEPGKAALIFSLESLFAAVGGALLLNEMMSGRAYAGCVFIFAGILVAQLKARKVK